jgi:dolichol kinase
MAASSTGTLDRVRRRLEGELGRRLVHSSGAVLPALHVLGVLSWLQVTAGFFLGLTAAVILETLRLYGGLQLWVYEHLTREYEQDNIAGYLLYMFSATTAAAIYGPTVGTPAIFMLAIADPISGTVSGEELRFVKRPRALAVMFVASAALAAPFLHEYPAAIVLGGLGGMVADGVKPRIRGYVIDDNFTIPLVAATAMWIGVEFHALL